jgi:hydrogenase-4 component E
VIITRFNALNQVVGYLVLENGVYLFGLILAPEVPLLVEMGILLDVFVAVFVMGIAIFHISREFDHLEVDQLTTLKD